MKTLRDRVVAASRILLPSELLRKRAVVRYYNTTAAIGRMLHRDGQGENLLDAQSMALQDTQTLDEDYRGNCLYGIAGTLREYASVSGKLSACAEHGVYFGDYVNPAEAVRSGMPAVITFSDRRRQHVRAVSTKTTFTVGPYINYARGLLDDASLAELKARHGRILLVFPSHSHDRESTHFDSQSFLEEVERFRAAESFDTVICCLYYWDVRIGRAGLYSDTDYLLSCAGHRYDPLFLSRLRSLIELSDHTLSNSVGTHIGYSVALDRPHTLIRQDVTWGNSASAMPSVAGSAKTRNAELEDVRRVFLTSSREITPAQREVCDRYWGLGRIRSREELNYILEACRVVFEQTKGRERLFDEAFRSLCLAEKLPDRRAILTEAVHHD